MDLLFKKTVLFFCLMIMTGCSTRSVVNLGVTDGQLSPCPDRPNCVSSQAADDGHKVDPLEYRSSREQAFTSLISVLNSRPGVVIMTKTDGYIHATFQSKIFRFTDDVEFFFPENSKIIHVRSASRVGYSDLGINRKRVEALRRAFSSAPGNG